MSKKEEKEQALNLRKRGFTLREIARYTDVSVSTVSLWLRDESWSKHITVDNKKRAAKENSKRISLLNTARGNQYKKLYAEAERSAITEYKHYKHTPLFMAGLMLYHALGDANDNQVIRLSSPRIESQRIFHRFVHEYLGVVPARSLSKASADADRREKVRFWLLLYPDHNPEKTSRVWSKALKLPLSQFHKYQVIQGKRGDRTSKTRLQYGVGNTIIGSAVLKRKLMKWIALSLQELVV